MEEISSTFVIKTFHNINPTYVTIHLSQSGEYFIQTRRTMTNKTKLLFSLLAGT